MKREIENFELIFKKYFKRLCLYAYKFVEDESIAQDIVQDVFLNLWDRQEIIEIEIVLRAYLFRSVYNRCLNHLGHKKVADKHHQIINRELKNIEVEYYGSSENHEHSLFELEMKIEKAVESLPPQCRNVFEMSRFKGMKNREIADELNISVKVVEKHITKALIILRENLIDYLSLLLIFINLS
jgi:RNA polymerase sigma-70 factor, ECF subfamily